MILIAKESEDCERSIDVKSLLIGLNELKQL
jgi:hypothetical protein